MKGIYALEIHLDKPAEIIVGALGGIRFQSGVYVYVGSAQNNLEKRISRHKRRQKKCRWHIDYLLTHRHAGIGKVFYKQAGREEECRTAKSLALVGQAVKGFGCSDCGCSSHLFRGDLDAVLYAAGMKVLDF